MFSSFGRCMPVALVLYFVADLPPLFTNDSFPLPFPLLPCLSLPPSPAPPSPFLPPFLPPSLTHSLNHSLTYSLTPSLPSCSSMRLYFDHPKFLLDPSPFLPLSHSRLFSFFPLPLALRCSPLNSCHVSEVYVFAAASSCLSCAAGSYSSRNGIALQYCFLYICIFGCNRCLCF